MVIARDSRTRSTSMIYIAILKYEVLLIVIVTVNYIYAITIATRSCPKYKWVSVSRGQ